MAIYAYKATDRFGKIVNDVLDAPDEKTAVALVQSKGYIPIRILEGGRENRSMEMDVLRPLRSIVHRVSGKDIMLFTQDLATLIEAGLPMDRALSILVGVAEKQRLKEIIQDILKFVQGGGSLSDAFSKYPKVFSAFYCNLVKAGEAGGVLESVLKRLGVFLENSQELKDYIKSAMVYPIFLLSVGGVSIIILMTFVIPRFAVIFADMGQAIPLSTQILLATSSFVKGYWWGILAIIAGGWFCFRKYSRTAAGRWVIDKYKLNLPISGEFIRKLEMARFSRTLATLIRSGVPILKALSLVKDIIGNRVIAGSIQRLNDRVKEGERLSKPLEENGVFPSLAIQMITVGEETGRLEEMLFRVAESYEKV